MARPPPIDWSRIDDAYVTALTAMEPKYFNKPANLPDMGRLEALGFAWRHKRLFRCSTWSEIMDAGQIRAICGPVQQTLLPCIIFLVLGFFSFVLTFTPGNAPPGTPRQIIANAALATIGVACIFMGINGSRCKQPE